VAEEAEGFKPEDFGIGKLFTRIQDAVIVGDARDGRIVLWNPGAERLFGYETDEALRMHLHALVPEQFRDAHLAGLERFNRTGQGDLVDSSKVVELPALRKNGSQVDIEFSLSRIGGTNQELTPFILAILRDVSFRKIGEKMRIEEQAAALRRIHGLELQDNLLQGLAVAKLALDVGETERATQALEQTLERARELITTLLEQGPPIEPGQLVRKEAASVNTRGANQEGRHGQSDRRSAERRS
jgi:PAS domain S-box-containing protein